MPRTALLGLAFVLTLNAGGRKLLPGQNSNDQVEITATAHPDKESIKNVLGSDLGGNYVLVKVTISPRVAKLPVHLDDFLLRTDRDGEKANPFTPSQIAGKGTLVISRGTSGGGGMMAESGPMWGGYPGGYPGGMGVPMGGGGVGMGGGGVEGASAKVNNAAKEKDNPLLKTLKDNILVEGDYEKPVSGYLYFPMDPKQKLKDLELIYTTSSGKLSVRFR